MPQNSNPRDLAIAANAAIIRRELESPSVDLLVDLFETLFFTSLKTEEGQAISCHIIWLDPTNPDPDPPKRIVSNRWHFVALTETISFNVRQLTKVAQATDPRSSSLAVFPDADGNLSISGFVDQGNSYFDFVNHNAETGPERPGLFQASILGIGHIAAYVGYEKIAELRANSLITRSYNVLSSGPVLDNLLPGISALVEDAKNTIGLDKFNSREHWTDTISSVWIETLCRLLIRAQNYHHGGAILITPNTTSGLSPKYGLNYSRIPSALRKHCINLIEMVYARDKIDGDHVFPPIRGERKEIPVDLYVKHTVTSYENSDTRDEIDGVIWFVSLLSRVDGLVLLTPQLEVKAFGTEITVPGDLTNVYAAKDESGMDEYLELIDYNYFGTRHRTMMRYCNSVPGSVGFVISQDGDVRVITKVGDKVILWNNVQLKQDDFDH